MSDFEDYLLDKTAEVSGSHTMPFSPKIESGKKNCPTKTVRKIANRVDVSGMSVHEPKVASQVEMYAMPSIQRYPLDSYVNVKQASVYFDDNYKHMAPVHRREYCVNLVKRASQLGIEVSPTIQKYGSADYASPGDLEVAFSCRRNNLLDETHGAVLDELIEKRAMMEPDSFAALLREFDEYTGLDSHYDSAVMDPYFSTYGKTATPKAFSVGGEYVTVKDLQKFALTAADQLSTMYPQDMVDEFKKDPESVFNSLPTPQKKAVARLVTQTLTGSTPT
jgi:hypothetical protein